MYFIPSSPPSCRRESLGVASTDDDNVDDGSVITIDDNDNDEGNEGNEGNNKEEAKSSFSWTFGVEESSEEGCEEMEDEGGKQIKESSTDDGVENDCIDP